MKQSLCILAIITLALSCVLIDAKRSRKNQKQSCYDRMQTRSCCPGSGCCGSPKKPQRGGKKNAKQIKQTVNQAYDAVAQSGDGCCAVGGCCGGGADLARYIGYTEQEIDELADANLGLGCGSPIKLGDIPKGATVLDLGSGAGFDCFLAAKRVGATGKVIGVDFTKSMLKKARANAKKYGFKNVEFRYGDIEQLPVETASVDIIMSNCVINLAPDKAKVFDESFRVLRSGGKMYISDVVLLKNLTRAQKNDSRLLSACVSGAILKDEYIRLLNASGFAVNIVDEDTQINRKWFNSDELPISSLKFVAYKK